MKNVHVLLIAIGLLALNVFAWSEKQVDESDEIVYYVFAFSCENQKCKVTLSNGTDFFEKPLDMAYLYKELNSMVKEHDLVVDQWLFKENPPVTVGLKVYMSTNVCILRKR
jgi:hypothetical protein